VATDLDEGRAAFGRRAWGDAHARLSAADEVSPLGIDDLERLAVTAYLVGKDAESLEAWTRAHQLCLDQADPRRAARCAFWSGFGLVGRGGLAQAGGWFARAHRVLEGDPGDGVEQGYLAAADAITSMFSGDMATALPQYQQVVELGQRFGDPDLLTLGQLGLGQMLVETGKAQEGIACLDEAMVAVLGGAVSPVMAGLVYCAVIETCQRAFDMRRAREWTGALSRWCASQPDLVPYRGQCLVHRAEILLMDGSWGDARHEVEQACERLAGEPAVADAYYQQAELHRLVGELAEAEDGYRRAHRWGRTPQPGLALLWLAQGRTEAADVALRGALEESQDRVGRPRLLAALVEVTLVAGDVASARAAADELQAIAGELGTLYLDAVAASTRGTLLLAEGDARTALASLRSAWRAWQDLEAPYEAARIRVAVAEACRQLGDGDTAEMELDAARWAFERLGARPDGQRVEALAAASRSGPGAAVVPGGLTGREVEVLRLVATGRTNHQIAEELVISDKTVARHLSNIFTKLGVPSRSAATAYAYEHGLV
jgi:ATP/maltotriose-dependent transcriptional regulator MalT